MATQQRLVLLVGASTVVAVALLLRRRCTALLINPPPSEATVDSLQAAVCRANHCKELWIFSDGEQPLVLDAVCKAAATQGINITVDGSGMQGFEDWLGSETDEAHPPPCLFIVTTDEEMELKSEGAQKCLKFLARRTNGPGTLRGLRFAVLGLGDSNHLAMSHRSISWASGKDCNQCGELFDRWLEQIGGTRMVRRGEMDARTDNDALDPWLDKLWRVVLGEDLRAHRA